MKKQFDQKVFKLLKRYKKLLLINKNWKFQYEKFDSKTSYAQVDYNFNKKTVVLSINPKFNSDDINLKDSIIHELFHIFLAEYIEAVDEVTKNHLSKKERNKLDRIEEKLVKKLTKIIINLESKQ